MGRGGYIRGDRRGYGSGMLRELVFVLGILGAILVIRAWGFLGEGGGLLGGGLLVGGLGRLLGRGFGGRLGGSFDRQRMELLGGA